MDKKIKYYETSNINLSAAIISKDIKLHSFKKDDGIVIFIFESPDICLEIEKKWLTGSLEVLAIKYSQAIKQLKNIVYGGQNAS